MSRERAREKGGGRERGGEIERGGGQRTETEREGDIEQREREKKRGGERDEKKVEKDRDREEEREEERDPHSLTHSALLGHEKQQTDGAVTSIHSDKNKNIIVDLK